MTLIYSNWSPHAGLIAISDILTSVLKGGPLPSIRLPLKTKTVSFSSPAYTLSGTAQKTIVANATMIQWSGRALTARSAIDQLMSFTNHGIDYIESVDFFSRSDLSELGADSVSLIYHFRSGPYLRRWQHRCERRSSDNSELFVEGSGSWDYMENTEVDTGSLKYGPMYFTSEAIARAFRVFSSEIRNRSNYNFHYGGWLEFAAAGSNTFNKSPVAIKLWRIDKNGKLDYFGPIFFSHYFQHDLYITSVSWREQSGTIFAVPNVFRVKDFLARSRNIATIDDIEFKPLILCHDVFDERDNSTKQVYDFEWTGIPMEFKIGQNGVDLSYAPSLTNRLLGLTTDLISFTVKSDINRTES